MIIELVAINEVAYGGYTFKLPGNVKRYIDFENSTAILVNGDKLRLVFIGLNTDEKGVTKLDIVNEFCIKGNVINFKKIVFQDKESLNIRIDDVIYIFDADNGTIIYETLTKG